MTQEALNAVTSVFRKGSLVNDAVSVILTEKGIIYDAWTDVRISKSLNQLCASFSISLIDKWKENKLPWFLKPGVKVVIKIGSDPAINGFIDRLDVDISNEDRRVEITGRDQTGDLVDSSAPTEPAEFKNLTILTLAQKFCSPFGIIAFTDTNILPAFTKFTVKQGETIFELLQRAANLRGLLLLSNEFGNLLITNRSLTSASVAFTPLVQGQNIISASASFDNTERFKTYTVKGQSEGNDFIFGLNVTSPQGVSTDSAINRPRGKTIIADGSVDFAGAQKRANWENTTRAAKSSEITVKVQGWRQFANGPLWKINQLVNVDIGYVGVKRNQLLISGIEFNKSIGAGTTTTLKLTRKDAFIPELPSLTASGDLQTDLGWEDNSFNIGL